MSPAMPYVSKADPSPWRIGRLIRRGLLVLLVLWIGVAIVARFLCDNETRRPATHGHVLYDGDDLCSNPNALKSDIGYVPQEVILHEGLPVAEALSFAARLRLPADTSRAEVQASIERVLATVGLTERRATLIRNLSGGQKKRVAPAYWGQQALTGMLDETTRQLIDAKADRGRHAWLPGALMLPVHALAYGVLSMLFLWRKDKHG